VTLPKPRNGGDTGAGHPDRDRVVHNALVPCWKPIFDVISIRRAMATARAQRHQGDQQSANCSFAAPASLGSGYGPDPNAFDTLTIDLILRHAPPGRKVTMAVGLLEQFLEQRRCVGHQFTRPRERSAARQGGPSSVH